MIAPDNERRMAKRIGARKIVTNCRRAAPRWHQSRPKCRRLIDEAAKATAA